MKLFNLFNENRFKEVENKIYRAFIKELKYRKDLVSMVSLEEVITSFITNYRMQEIEIMFQFQKEDVRTMTFNGKERRCILYTFPVKGNLDLLQTRLPFYPTSYFNIKAAMDGGLLVLYHETAYKKDVPVQRILWEMAPPYQELKQKIIQTCSLHNEAVKAFNLIFEKEITDQVASKYRNCHVNNIHNAKQPHLEWN